MPPRWSDTTVDNNGVRIAVRDYGGAGRPAVLVHGGPGQNLAAWDDFAPTLTPELHALALDVRGNGASDDAADYSWPALVSDIHAVIEGLRLPSPLLVGHSWGGQLVTYYAAQYREAAGVVAIDGWMTDVHTELGDGVWRWMEESYADDPFIRFCGTAAELELMLADIELRFGRSAAAVGRRQFVEGKDRVFRWRRSVSDLIHVQRTIESEGRVLGSVLYAAVHRPVLLIGGERSEADVQAAREGRLGEWAFSRSATDPIVERFDHLTAEWWACGHDIPRELPERLASRIKTFASEL
jgi:pimeloyl-ACP methyl ester carboxylesterase